MSNDEMAGQIYHGDAEGSEFLATDGTRMKHGRSWGGRTAFIRVRSAFHPWLMLLWLGQSAVPELRHRP